MHFYYLTIFHLYIYIYIYSTLLVMKLKFLITIYDRYIVLLSNYSTTPIIEMILSIFVIQTEINSSKIITYIIINNKNNYTAFETGVYSIFCSICNKIYKCETCETKKRLCEHIRDFNLGDFRRALVKHNLVTKYTFNFKDSKTLFKIHNN